MMALFRRLLLLMISIIIALKAACEVYCGSLFVMMRTCNILIGLGACLSSVSFGAALTRLLIGRLFDAIQIDFK